MLKNSLLTRIISAVLAILLLFGLHHFFPVRGFIAFCSVAVIIIQFELLDLLFKKSPFPLRHYYFVFALISYLIATLLPSQRLPGLVLAGLIYTSCFLVFFSRKFTLEETLQFLSKSLLGVFYGCLLPFFAYQLLLLPQGTVWFSFLLIVILTGDTFAYFFGLTMGKKKIFPHLSPKKTVVGSLGGLLGSMLGAFAMGHFLTEMSSLSLILLGFGSGVLGQFGDFFESLLKRVANVKDSGNLMPGHGGILDRADGLLFAIPLVYVFASHFS